MLFRNWAGAADIARFPKLRAIVRMGVGYDRIDRAAAKYVCAFLEGDQAA